MADDNKNSPPAGQLYSKLYHPVTTLRGDSPRARSRIGYFLAGAIGEQGAAALFYACQRQFGLEPEYGYQTYNWREFVDGLDANDFFDLITVAETTVAERYATLKKTGIRTADHNELTSFSQGWLPFCRKVFAEEGLNFRIDEKGGVHPLVDEEFQAARHTLLGILDSKRYAGARDHFETAHKHFAERPPETRQAIWSMFQCVETLFQLLVGSKLNRGNIESKLTPILRSQFASDDETTWKSIAASLADWVDAFHRYRHGQPEETPRTASVELCVYALSSGASMARLLAQLDADRQNNGAA